LESLWDLFDFESCRSLRIEIGSRAGSHTVILLLIIVLIVVIKFGSGTCWVSRFDTISGLAFAKLGAMSSGHL
jgi:hypothetical protein